jgi:cell division protein FtsW (lipid II flippase)
MKTAVTMLITCVAGLLATGMVTLYSATMNSDGARYLEMQVIWFGLGLVACVAATVIDYRKLKLGVWPLYIFVALLLTAVLIPDIGLKIKGARRWLPIGPFTFQPSELAKLALILMLAWYADSYSRQMRTWKRGILFPGILIAVYIGLIFPEPDRGTSVLLAGLGGVMLITAGVRITQLVPPVVAAVAAWSDGGTWRITNPVAHTRPTRGFSRSVRGDGLAWDWATAAKSSAFCRSITPISSCRSSVKNWAW